MRKTVAGGIEPLSERDFDQIREMVYRACGISLQPGKRSLVSSRLERLVRRQGHDSFREYLAFLSMRRSGPEFADFIDTLTTNHSGFWREPEHFNFLRRFLLTTGRASMRIWSAACATGQEPYTIGMCALESGVPACRILASDISRAALSVAARGVYEAAKLRELPQGWAGRYSEVAGSSSGDERRITPAVRALVTFCQLNLLLPFEHLGLFDVIFCRNVMIYFDQPARDQLVDRLARQLSPDGILFTGHSETLLQLPPAFRCVQPATYRRCA